MKKTKFFRYITATLIISPIALFIGLASTGAGDGDYFGTKILFPYTMLSTHLTNHHITAPFAIFALFQFPLYGLLIALASLKRMDIFVLVIILLPHLIAAYLCFYWPMPNFS